MTPETSDTMSRDPSVHRALAERQRLSGDELGALAHLAAAHTLEAHAAGTSARTPTALLSVATGYFTKGDHDTALRWYEFVLALDPDLAIAHQNLAAIHAAKGNHAQSDECRARAYRIQRVFEEPVADAARRLLILCAGRTSGNVPFETLLSSARSTRIKYVIDFAAEEEDAQLPAFDLVFNAIGEPDVAAPLTERLTRFAERCGCPLLNGPAAVERTQRHRLVELLGDLADVVLAPCSRHDHPPASRAELLERLQQSDIVIPALVRPIASHGGKGLVRCDAVVSLADEVSRIAGAHYVTAFRDYRSADGYFRKYRIVFVDGEPFPYHLAISSHWMVHYFSADMLSHPWKIAEEHSFLDDAGAALGERAMAAVVAIGRRLALDYAGIDFTILPDGQVFVFEANATMLVHRERNDGELAYRNASVQRIVDAFERMQSRRVLAHAGGAA